jgi:uncharacterized protein (DUF305 family)
MRIHVIGTCLIAAFTTTGALAQQQHESHGGKSSSPSSEMQQRMMKGSKESMQMKPSGDMDRDFARMMRHHHQMGVQMAEQEMKNGKDPKMKEMAGKIAESQKEEIKQFDEWLKTKGGAKK